MEKTFVMVKPDGVKRNLVGEIIRRLEAKGLQLLSISMLQMSPELAAEHYREHTGKDYFPNLVRHITSGPVVAMVWQGQNAVGLVRLLVGNKDPMLAGPGTIRGDFAQTSSENLVHAADSVESAKRESALIFDRSQ